VAAKMVRKRAVDWDLDGAMFCLGSHGLRVVSRLGVHGCCSVTGRKLLGVLPASPHFSQSNGKKPLNLA
jgi:hypothetical protein